MPASPMRSPPLCARIPDAGIILAYQGACCWSGPRLRNVKIVVVKAGAKRPHELPPSRPRSGPATYCQEGITLAWAGCHGWPRIAADIANVSGNLYVG